MGAAIMSGLLAKKQCTTKDLMVVEALADRRKWLEEKFPGLYTCEAVKEAAEARLILLAVKPYHLDEVGAILKPLLTDQHLVISILAGKTRENMAAAMGRLGRMVRVMPNLPASVGYGVR